MREREAMTNERAVQKKLNSGKEYNIIILQSNKLQLRKKNKIKRKEAWFVLFCWWLLEEFNFDWWW